MKKNPLLLSALAAFILSASSFASDPQIFSCHNTSGFSSPRSDPYAAQNMDLTLVDDNTITFADIRGETFTLVKPALPKGRYGHENDGTYSNDEVEGLVSMKIELGEDKLLGGGTYGREAKVFLDFGNDWVENKGYSCTSY